MATKIDDLRQLLQDAINIQTQQSHNNQNRLQEIRTLANTATNSKDAKEILKPILPEIYRGVLAKLTTFLTQC